MRQIQLFVAVVQQGGLSKAAEQLSMSQSAASSALKELEDGCGHGLFDRVGKRLQLNSFGQRVLPAAQRFLGGADDLAHAISPSLDVVSLRLGATLTIGSGIAIDLIAQFYAQNPGLKAHLVVENTQGIVDALTHYRIDLALIEGEVNHPDVSLYPWMEDPLAVVASVDHPYAKLAQVTDRQLLDAHWVVRESGSGTRQAMERSLSGIFSSLTIRLELTNAEAIKRALLHNLGLSVLSQHAVKDEVERGELVLLSVPQRTFTRQLYWGVSRGGLQSESVNAFIDTCLR